MSIKNETKTQATTTANTEEAVEPAPLTVPNFQSRPVGLLFFAQTNAWRIDGRGERVSAVELMGGFIHVMSLAGKTAGTEEYFREAFDKYCNS